MKECGRDVSDIARASDRVHTETDCAFDSLIYVSVGRAGIRTCGGTLGCSNSRKGELRRVVEPFKARMEGQERPKSCFFLSAFCF